MRGIATLVFLLSVVPAHAQSDMSLDWEWKKDHRCSNTSPALSVAGLPEGTKSLAVQMRDLDFNNKDHGGGTLGHTGGDSASVPEGALTSNYIGPCPSNYSSFGHSYQITVRALAADGTELAKVAKAKDFSARTAK